jgi:5-formyltetrahydrofolate cyclo-ligase
MDPKIEKDRLRAEILLRRDALPPESREEKSRAIAFRLFSFPGFTESKIIMFYVSFRSEVNTHQMIRKALSLGKNVAVPFTDRTQRTLIPSMVKDINKELIPNRLGIPEPLREHLRPVKKTNIDLVIIPGSMFDRRGGRAGYGYGYYDHFLKQLDPHTKRLALAFELQLVDTVPMESNDEYVDFIITEKRIIHCTA